MSDINAESREIRIFISSTFRDMQKERDYLVNKTFPELRRIASERNVILTEVDLRWGVTQEESEQGKTIEICMDEIKGSRPFFIGLLGDRYGWCPTRQELSAQGAIPARYDWIGNDLDNGLSITEIEIQFGVLRAEEEIFASFHIKESGNEEDPRQSRLKEVVRNQQRYPWAEYSDVEELGEQVKERFISILDELYPKDEAGDEFSDMEMIFNSYMKESARTYIPNPAYLDALDRFLTGEDAAIVISGSSGMGKSALLAYWIDRHLASSDSTYVMFFADNSPDLRPDDVIRYIRGSLSKKRHCERPIIIIDGIDQIESGDTHFDWCKAVPEGARLIISAADDTSALEDLRSEIANELRIHPLMQTQKQALVRQYFGTFSKHVQEVQVDLLTRPCKMLENTLIFVTMLEEVRRFGQYDDLTLFMDEISSLKSVEDFYDFILERKEKTYGTKENIHLVKDILSLIAVSKNGLQETELLEVSRIPMLHLSQFTNGNTLIITRRGGYLRFTHSRVMESAVRRYLGEDEELAYRIRIAEYFEQADTCPRKDEELPYQYWKSGEFCHLYEYIGTLGYLSRQYNAHSTYFLRYWSDLLAVDCEYFDICIYLQECMRHEHSLKMYNPVIADFTIKFINILDNVSAALKIARRAYLALSFSHDEDLKSAKETWMQMIANAENRRGNYHSSLKWYLNIIMDMDDESDTGLLSPVYANLAENYLCMAEESKDVGYAERAYAIGKAVLEARINAFGENNEETAISYSNLASTLNYLGRKDEAAQMYHKSAGIYAKIKGEDNIDSAIDYCAIARHLNRTGKAEEGLEYALKALKIFDKVSGRNNSHSATACMIVIESLRLLSRKDEALAYLKEYTDIMSNISSGEEFARSMMMAAGMMIRQFKRPEPAKELLEKALEELNVGNNASKAACLDMLGRVYLDMNMMEQSVNAYSQAKDIWLITENPAKAADSLAYSARPLNIIGQYEEARSALEECLGIRSRYEIEVSEEVAFAYQNLAAICLNMDLLQESIGYMQKAYDTRVSLFGEDDRMAAEEYLPFLNKLMRKFEEGGAEIGHMQHEEDDNEAKEFARYCHGDEKLIESFLSGRNAFREHKAEQAIHYFKEGLRLLELTDSDSEDSMSAEAMIMRYLAYTYELSGNPESLKLAEKYYDEGREAALMANNLNAAISVIFDETEFYWNRKEWQSAIRGYSMSWALRLYQNGPSEKHTLISLANLCYAMMNSGDYDSWLMIHLASILAICSKEDEDMLNSAKDILSSELGKINYKQRYTINSANSLEYIAFNHFINDLRPFRYYVEDLVRFISFDRLDISSQIRYLRVKSDMYTYDREGETYLLQALDMIRLNPEAVEDEMKDAILKDLGWIYSWRTDYRKAVDVYAQCGSLGQKHCARMINALIHVGDISRAISVMESLDDECGSPFLTLQKGLLECFRGNHETGLELIGKYQESYPDDILAISYLALAYHLCGETARSMDIYHQMAGKETDSYNDEFDKLSSLIFFLTQTGNLDEAEYYRKIALTTIADSGVPELEIYVESFNEPIK